MKNNIKLIIVFVFVFMSFPLITKASDKDCYYEIKNSKGKTTIVEYNIGGSVELIKYEDKTKNRTVINNSGDYSTDKCYPYVSIREQSRKQNEYTYYFKLGNTESDVKFGTSEKHVVLKKSVASTATPNKNQKIEDSLVVTPVDVCSQDSGSLKAFQIVGYIILICKILVPVILIIMGSIDFAKAALSGDDNSTKGAAVKFGMRILTGLVIFFIPTILDFFLSLVSGTSEVVGSFQNCTNCVLNPNNKGKCNPKGLGSK